MSGIVGWLFGSSQDSEPSAPRPEPIVHRFAMRRDQNGTWQLSGVSDETPHDFPSLDAAVAYARRDSDAEPATIEIWVDGAYICCVQQEQGWPERICA
jgi:hypothetical protein